MTAARRRHPERHARVGRANARCGVQVRAANARTRRGGGSKARGVSGRCGRPVRVRSRYPSQADAADRSVWGAGIRQMRLTGPCEEPVGEEVRVVT